MMIAWFVPCATPLIRKRPPPTPVFQKSYCVSVSPSGSLAVNRVDAAIEVCPLLRTTSDDVSVTTAPTSMGAVTAKLLDHGPHCVPSLVLILLRHRARWPVRVNLRAQQGHRGSRVRAIATANLRCSVAIESGTCRCGRIGGAAGSVTGGKGRYFEPPEETRS